MKKIIVIIPTYNEEKNIKKLVKSIFNVLPNCNIVIVDDSKHKNVSLALVGELKKKNLIYIHRKNSKGRGSAVLQGLKTQLSDKKDQIFIEMDADFSHNPLELKRNLKKFILTKSHLLIASRYLPKSKILNWTLFRRLFSRLANFLASILLNIGTTDYTNGFRIYSKNAAKLIVDKCGKIGDGFIVLSEILLVIHQNKLKISEIETIFVNRTRGESSVNIRLIVHSFFGLIKLYLMKNKKGKNIL